MIEVHGDDVRVGNATGEELIDEATKAVYGTFFRIKRSLEESGKDFNEHHLMIYLLQEIGRNLAHMDTEFHAEIISAGDPDDPDEFLKVFGDLLK